MKIKTKYIILAIFIALAGILALGWYLGAKKANNALNPIINALNDQIIHYEIRIRDDSAFIATKEQEIVRQKQALRKLGLDNADLKALNIKLTSEIIEAMVRIDTLLDNIGHNGQIVTIHDTVYKERNAILLPFDFTKSDKFMNMKGSFDKLGKLSISLETWATVDIISGVSKDGKRTTSVISNSPYLKTIDVASFKTDEKKPKKWGVGLSVGYGISKDGLSPSVLFGIHRSILRF